MAEVSSSVQVPSYDPTETQAGIVHLGVGNFHRAHQAICVDDALQAGEMDWAISGVSLRSQRMRNQMFPQDCLYSLTCRGRHGSKTRVIAAHKNVISHRETPDHTVAVLTDPRTRIVSLTISEKGYCAAQGTGGLLTENEGIMHDLIPFIVPMTTIGLLADALKVRQKRNAPITLLSCDNLTGNGNFLKSLLSEFVAIKYPEILGWLQENVSFPNSMVDRISPATSPNILVNAESILGLSDMAAVEAEHFFQWVIEDNFVAGRPEFERSGVELTKDAAPYEIMKLRMLNGAHTTLAAAGLLAGKLTVQSAMETPELARLLKNLWAEIAVTIDRTLDIEGYSKQLTERFLNPSIVHETSQIATDGSQKIPQRLLAPLCAARAIGAPTRAISFAIAAWIRSNGGQTDHGQPLTISDPSLRGFTSAPSQNSEAASQIVDAWITHSGVFVSRASLNPNISQEITQAYGVIRQVGVLKAVHCLLELEET